MCYVCSLEIKLTLKELDRAFHEIITEDATDEELIHAQEILEKAKENESQRTNSPS